MLKKSFFFARAQTEVCATLLDQQFAALVEQPSACAVSRSKLLHYLAAGLTSVQTARSTRGSHALN